MGKTIYFLLELVYICNCAFSPEWDTKGDKQTKGFIYGTTERCSRAILEIGNIFQELQEEAGPQGRVQILSIGCREVGEK
jgi:hypothetical protein